MKQNYHRSASTHQPPYPGAADPRYFTEKAKELLFALLTSICALAAMMSMVLLA